MIFARVAPKVTFPRWGVRLFLSLALLFRLLNRFHNHKSTEKYFGASFHVEWPIRCGLGIPPHHARLPAVGTWFRRQEEGREETNVKALQTGPDFVPGHLQESVENRDRVLYCRSG